MPGMGGPSGAGDVSDAGHGSTAGRKPVKPQIIPATGLQCDMTPCQTVAGARDSGPMDRADWIRPYESNLEAYERNLDGLSMSQKKRVFREASSLRDRLGYMELPQVRAAFPFLLSHRNDEDVSRAQFEMTESLGALQLRLLPGEIGQELTDVAKESSEPFTKLRGALKLRGIFDKSVRQLADSWMKKTAKNAKKQYEDTVEAEVAIECGNVITQTFSCYVVFPLPLKPK